MFMGNITSDIKWKLPDGINNGLFLVAQCFDCCCDKLCGCQTLEQVLKTTRYIGRSIKFQLPMKNATLFLPSQKYQVSIKNFYVLM